MLKGIFTPTAEAKALSKAPHFQSSSTPILVRFSDSTGLPEIPDFVGDARPNGLAVRFDLGTKDGKRWHTDIVGHSVPHFPVPTGADFAQLLMAIGGSPAGTPSPSPIEKYLQAHPAAFRFVTAPKPAVKSFGTQNFYMLNAFKFIAPDGKEHYIRYRVLADEGLQTWTDDEAKAKGPNYLFEEIVERVKTGPIGFKLFAQIAEEGDTTDNITAEWPEDRKLVELGSLKIDSIVDNSTEKQKHDIFDPIPRVDGIEASADPILEFRAGLYLIGGRDRRARHAAAPP